MIWTVNDRGFLPASDPVVSLPMTNLKNAELVFTWENLIDIIPQYLKQECLREELICALRQANQSYYHGFIDSIDSQMGFERVFLILAMFSHSYINAPEGRRKTKLPKEITIPFSRVSHLVSRNPIIDYTSYFLCNWQKKDKGSSEILNNIEPLLSFTDTYEEKLLIRTMIKMECLGGSILENFDNIYLVRDTVSQINKLVKATLDSIDTCFIKQFFRNFDDLFYEGWVQEPRSFACDLLLLQSPFLLSVFKYLDIRFKSEYILNQMEKCSRPQPHRDFLQKISPIRQKCHRTEMKSVYNELLEEVIAISANFLKATKDNAAIAREELSIFKL